MRPTGVRRIFLCNEVGLNCKRGMKNYNFFANLIKIVIFVIRKITDLITRSPEETIKTSTT